MLLGLFICKRVLAGYWNKEALLYSASYSSCYLLAEKSWLQETKSSNEKVEIQGIVLHQRVILCSNGEEQSTRTAGLSFSNAFYKQLSSAAVHFVNTLPHGYKCF